MCGLSQVKASQSRAMHTLSELRSGALSGITRLDLSEGLTELPSEVFDLADTLEVLNLSGNALSTLPDDLPRLRKLRVLFCSDNRFTRVPEVLGQCPQLSMVGFKANQICEVPAASLPRPLRWLILTDNQIDTLPDELGHRPRLEKVALAGNRLTTLPDTLAACHQLALLRISANAFEAFPEWLWTLPSLSWLALAGNPATQALEAERGQVQMVPKVAWTDLRVHEVLGQGASGVIHRVDWVQADGRVQAAALKVFKGALTSDGWPRSEVGASLSAGHHPHLIGVIGQLTDHPQGLEGLLMPLVDAGLKALAEPPSLNTCSRDVYPPGRAWTLDTALRMAQESASALAHLHERGLMHGDFYGHNLLWREGEGLMLGDFGAATPFDPNDRVTAQRLARIEVRAWGCFLQELLTHLTAEDSSHPQAQGLEALRAQCMGPVLARPAWTAIKEKARQV
jgi:Protein tyrosine and serine/threonine kinase/Leucine rich repeat